MDRYDALAALGFVAVVVGAVLVHPALLLVAFGYAAINIASRRMS